MEKYLIDLLGKICIPLVIGYITFMIAKRQIINTGVTQFRQKWIDNLRDCISIYIAKAELIAMLELDDDEGYFKHFKELAQTQYKIELMLNPNEAEHNEIVRLNVAIRDLVHEEDIDDDKLDELIKKLTDTSKPILKKEWNRVKQGK